MKVKLQHAIRLLSLLTLELQKRMKLIIYLPDGLWNDGDIPNDHLQFRNELHFS